MMKYIIVKASRTNTGHPYSGPTCDNAGIPRGKVYDDYNTAYNHAKILTEYNPVGFVVYEHDNGE